MTRLICLWLVCLTVAADDSFQVLRDDAEGFADVIPGKEIQFPRDHGAHPEFRIEWWYLTANLTDRQGRDWGLQWTLFRQALSANAESQHWSNNQLWMAHAAVTAPDGHHFEQRFARGGIGQAGVTLEDDFEAWIDDWHWRAKTNTLFPSNLIFRVADLDVSMQLTNRADWLLQGDAGYSQKSQQGQASYYYSQPNIRIQGSINGEQLSGTAWLDREWSSQPLAPNQQGWDWFSLHLNDGSKLMLYRLRHEDDDHWLSGSWVNVDGQKTALKAGDIELLEHAFRPVKLNGTRSAELPLDWVIRLPGLNREFLLKPLYDQQWMGTRFPYWEGVVQVEDGSGNFAGRGYMELTGYQ